MNTGDADTFYAARDVRTVEYGADVITLSRPIAVVISAEVARTRAGQVAAFALVDQLMRVHRCVRIDAPDVPVVCAAGKGSLDAAIVATAKSIDPFQDTARASVPGELLCVIGDQPVNESSRATIGEDGQDPPSTVRLRWRGGRGEVLVNGVTPPAPDELPEVDPDLDVLGASTAAVLAAAAVFGLVHGRTPRSAAVNVLERTADADAGVTSAVGHIDVGDTVIVGAGAVAHGFGYWVREFGHAGAWHVVDRDLAEVHNTSRCLGMTVADAGWLGGVPTGQARAKAASAAALVSGAEITSWWHEYSYDTNARPDVLLVLANEHGVRTDIATLGVPLMLQATTSSDWTAEVHRHIAGRDDCPGCRIPDRPGQLLCATGPAIPGDAGSSDAALPFLSAGAGLLLAAALLDLRQDGAFLVGRANHWRLHLELGPGLWQRVPHPGGGCPHELPAAVRRRLRSKAPRRWDVLDAFDPRRHAP